MEEYIKTGSKAMKNVFWIFVIAFLLLFIHNKPKGFDTIYFTLAFPILIYIVYYLHVRLFPLGEIQFVILTSFFDRNGTYNDIQSCAEFARKTDCLDCNRIFTLFHFLIYLQTLLFAL